ncbi:hypothetical protein [Actinoplanes regularis]|uniref:hypothetical protein n=1 Tax=Actinoplanes regularis TaxID=52697 RepID=UPI00249FFA70|nr:hypothetical protein [Actinoplanes regularis]GLW35408.1 hypothetical protein Areg01_83440 [Actinoplanes regularis]
MNLPGWSTSRAEAVDAWIAAASQRLPVIQDRGFAHSYGAVCALGAAAQGAPVRRIALYEPPGPQTVPAPWLERLHAFVAVGELGRAVGSFLIEVIGLPREQVLAMRDTPMAYDPLLAPDLVTGA